MKVHQLLISFFEGPVPGDSHYVSSVGVMMANRTRVSLAYATTVTMHFAFAPDAHDSYCIVLSVIDEDAAAEA